MKPFITYASQAPAIVEDRVFFAINPQRRYRARHLLPGESGLPLNVVAFASDERGETAEINLVILKRRKGGRIRCHFAAFADAPLNTDKHIKAFLHSRRVALFRLCRKGKQP